MPHSASAAPRYRLVVVLATAFVAALLGLAVLADLPAWRVALAMLPIALVLSLLLGSAGLHQRGACRIGIMSLAGLLGGLAGVWLEFGSRGLAVLGSWCVTTPLSGVELLLAKAERLPALPLGMAAASMLAMLALAQVSSLRERLQCCAFMLLGMPIALGAADLLVLNLLGAGSDWVAPLMLALGTSAMAIWSAGVLSITEQRRKPVVL